MKRKASKGQVALSRLELMERRELFMRFLDPALAVLVARIDAELARADTSATIKEAECQSPEALNSGEIGASGVKL